MLESIIRKVADSYLETALWSSSDWDDMDDSDNPTPFDENYDCSDFSENARTAAYDDCQRFLEALEAVDCNDGRYCDSLLDCADEVQGYDRIGHDFWLTRNGHGAGFWDGDYGDYGDRICDVLYATFGRYSECTLYVNCDGEIDIE
jgi:hypothetical protein